MNDKGDAHILPAWEDLTQMQQVIVREAIEYSLFVVVLNACVPMPDAPYWNRKGQYVPLLAAETKELVELGLVEVYVETDDPRNDRLLEQAEGLKVVSDPKNWWQYDPNDNWDPNEQNIPPEGWDPQEPRLITYTLNATPAGFAVSRAKKNPTPPSPTVIYSRGSTGGVDLSARWRFWTDKNGVKRSEKLTD